MGVHSVVAKYFKCSIDWAYTKRSLHQRVNSIFVKVGRTASEESVFQLITGKCLSILLDGLETCPLKNADLRSLDFVIDRLFVNYSKLTTWILSGNVSSFYLRQGGYVIVVVCLSVCLSVGNFAQKTSERICMKFSGKVGCQ